MIGVALALQVAAGAVAGPTAVVGVPSIIVVAGERVTRVTTREIDGVRLLRADQLAAALGAVYRDRPGAARTLVLGPRTISVDADLRWLRADDDLVPLADAPREREGQLWVPSQVATDVLPRVVPGVVYEPSRTELRVFRMAVPERAVAERPVTTSIPARRTPPTEPPNRTIGAPRPTRDGPPSQRTVIVDAGHGGPDRGMHGPWGCRGSACVYEADITLDVAREVASALRARGVRVVMTRTTDTLIALSDRGRIANRAKGDLFLSIHVNAANPRWKSPGAARGFETYFLSEAKTEDERRVAQMENEAVRFETTADAPAGDDLSFLLNDMAQNEHLRESNDVAQLVQGALRRVHPGPNRGVKQAGFRVLVTAFMPAVLIEIGFGTNPREASWMTDRREQSRMADAIAEAAVTYLERYERRVSGAGGGR
ncbi:MAG: N-acetylmuramoyl-L-alanine amidase [Gemmatimonadaceae bacterium]|nr:N-acetylmuramoyl-L-alanine amidase [Gemmatimonadaceae bacterium]